MNDMQNNVDQLNSFLRGEISAVETYRQALEALDKSAHRPQLMQCKQSHEQRVTLLTQQIRSLGGEPASSSGAWGAFAKLVEGTAAALGEKAAIAALEEGEDHGNADYGRDVDKLDPAVRSMVAQQIVPLQRKTHAEMSALKKKLS
jgi:uncharacterized protein (TIGR02284 family)